MRLYQFSRKRSIAVKSFLLAGQAVVGVGNIYCSESLFEAGIHPRLPAGKLTKIQCARLADSVRNVLSKAIKAGGSSLRDFVDAHGEPGYFMMQTKVYDRAGEACRMQNTDTTNSRGNALHIFAQSVKSANQWHLILRTN